jgi:hypothetical protein
VPFVEILVAVDALLAVVKAPVTPFKPDRNVPATAVADCGIMTVVVGAGGTAI